MRKLRDWWQAWLKNPDWRQMGVLQSFGLLATLGAMLVAVLPLVAFVFETFDPGVPSPLQVGLGTWLAVLAIYAGFLFFFRQKIAARPNPLVENPVRFPAPPMASWDRLRTKYGKTTGDGVVNVAFTFAVLPGFVFASPAFMLQTESNVVVIVWFLLAAAAFSPVIYLQTRYETQLRQLGEKRWEESLHSVRIPAEARVSELASLADELKAQAMSAAAIVHEANEAFAQLQTDIADRQAESTALLDSVTTNSTVLAQNQEAVDALFQVWTDRQQAAAAAQEKRSRRWDVRLAVIFLIIGLAVGVFLPTDTIRQSLGWG